MEPPDWSKCTEDELWRYVAWHLEGEGIRSVLVGGAVVAIYTEGLYRSGDLDMVPDDLGRNRLISALAKIGFEPTQSRYFKHPGCAHLFLEFPRGPVEIGEQYPVIPDEIHLEGRTLRLLSPTDSVKDRLAGYYSLEIAGKLRPGPADLSAATRPGEFGCSARLVRRRGWYHCF